MPSASHLEPRRMSRHQQAPRLSFAMAAIEDGDRKSRSRIHDFCCTNVKGIVTVVMLFAMIICVVLIVMVHKWQYENGQKACIDVAVIGGGASGTYAAWRLRNHNLSIRLFESTDRIGGRMYTHHLSDFDGVNAELGALYYLPQRHRLLHTVILALRLTPREWRLPKQGLPTYYLRGRRLHASDLSSHKVRLPYRLPDGEKYHQPHDLMRLLLSRALSSESNATLRPLEAKSKGGTYLFMHGFWNLLNTVGTHEAFNFLYDTAPWRSLLSNQNAAQLAAIALEPEEFSETEDKRYTLKEGMSSVPDELRQQFVEASASHAVKKNRRLSCMRKEDDLYKLVLRKTITTRQHTHDINDHELVCAKKVILALPRGPLERIQWEQFQKDATFRENLRSVRGVPALVAYFGFSDIDWIPDEPELTDVITDLPIRRVRYMGRGTHNGVHRHLLMVACVDSVDVNYLKALLELDWFNGSVKVSYPDDTRFVEGVKSQLADVFGISKSKIPRPSSVIFHHWSATDGGAWHLWERGVEWSNVARRMIRPHDEEQVYVVGSAYSGGEHQLWAEGALQSVDNMMQRYFQNDA